MTFTGEYIFTLREDPVRKVLSVHAATTGTVQQRKALVNPENLVDPSHYYCLPDEGSREDIPFSLVLRPPLRISRKEYMPFKTLVNACFYTGQGKLHRQNPAIDEKQRWVPYPALCGEQASGHKGDGRGLHRYEGELVRPVGVFFTICI
ncbi:MAG: hypothetical protein LBB80_03865 [Treponema sp.]|nr:hypothetical protein [Treponema sp.]